MNQGKKNKTIPQLDLQVSHQDGSSCKASSLPQLIESDLEIWTEYLGDYLDMWTKNGPRFLEDQKFKMVRLALCPFLFDVTENLPSAWIKVLINFGVLERERDLQLSLTSSQLEVFEMAEFIFRRCADLTVGSKKDLKEILNFIYDVEEKVGLGGPIDANYALERLPQLKLFPSIWVPIRRTFEKKKRHAHICILYFFKTIHHQIVHYGRDGQDKAELLRKAITDKAREERLSSGDTEPYAKQAHSAFREGHLTDALQLYTKALEFDPCNSLHYSNRALTNIQMKSFADAVSDCWRAIVLDQNNSSKSCFRAAKCYFELGRLDRAAEMNEQAMEFCTDPKQQEQIQSQAQEINQAQVKLKYSRYRSISNSENVSQEETGSVDLPGLGRSPVLFRKLQCEGSNLYLGRKFVAAVDKYHEALEILTSEGVEALETQMQDVLILNYCYGLACVQTKTYNNLQCAIEKFNYVISRITDFPAAHYGLGLAYKTLNRFQDALCQFQLAMDKRKSAQQYQWPQTVIAMEETDPDILKRLLKGLIQDCNNPPRPDAICRFHPDSDNFRTEIFFSDPDYKGFIRLHCTWKCSVEFHSNCWKTHKHKSHTDKEMLDMACPTQNCWGTINILLIYKPDGDPKQPVTLKSTKEREATKRKPMLKMKASSPFKIQRKMEKKRLKKERKEEERKEKAKEEEERRLSANAEVPVVTFNSMDGEQDLRSQTAATQEIILLKREDPDVLLESKAKQKAPKTKKKKEKTKQLLTFDLQFSADKDKELLGVNSLDDEGDYVSQPGLLGSHPATLTQSSTTAATTGSSSLLPTPRTVFAGNGLLPIPLVPQPSKDIFSQNLIECFVTILQGGPVELDSMIVQDILGSVPGETRSRVAACGGIAAFLSAQPQFVVVGGRVGLTKGGPGLLSNTDVASEVMTTGNAAANGLMKIPYAGGAGLLKTPANVPVGGGGVASSATSAWGLSAGGSTVKSPANQQKGLLGEFPKQTQKAAWLGAGLQQGSAREVDPWQQRQEQQRQKQGKQSSGLNPSAMEFVPESRRKSFPQHENCDDLLINGKVSGGNSKVYRQEEDEGDENDYGEFVTVTHKKGVHSKSAKFSQLQSSTSFQNPAGGDSSNMYNLLQEPNSGNFSLAEDNSKSKPEIKLASRLNGTNQTSLLLQNNSQTNLSSSSNSTSTSILLNPLLTGKKMDTLSRPISTSTTHQKGVKLKGSAITMTLPTPPSPSPPSITAVAASLRSTAERRVSDASSTLSDDPRASSPASSTSQPSHSAHLSQGSGNSQVSASTNLSSASRSTTSGGGGAVPVCPPKPLKTSSLNLPKRSKKRDLREKVMTRTSGQQSVSKTSSSLDAGLSMREAENEGDDMESVSSENSNKSSISGWELSNVPLYTSQMAETLAAADFGMKKIGGDGDNVNSFGEKFPSNILGTAEKSHMYSGVEKLDDLYDVDVSSYSGLDNALGFYGTNITLPHSAKKSDMGDRSGGLSKPAFFPGMHDYSSSLELSLGAGVGKNEESGSQAASTIPGFSRVSENCAVDPKYSSFPQAMEVAVGQRHSQSRVLRNLGLSSHSPSPPLFTAEHQKQSQPDNADCSSSSTSPSPSFLHSGVQAEHQASAPVTGLEEETLHDLGSELLPEKTQYPSTEMSVSAVHPSDPWSRPHQYDLYTTDSDVSYLPLYKGKEPSKPQSNFQPYLFDSGPLSKSSSDPLLPSFSVLTKPAGVSPNDRPTWSPLSSDSLHTKLGTKADSNSGSWPSFAQTHASETAATVPPITSLAAATQTVPPKVATVSVNTELTGEKLKALQQKYYEVREERDTLKAQARAAQEEKEAEKTLREAAEEELKKYEMKLKDQEEDLQARKKHSEAVEKERDRLRQALQQALVKISKLTEDKAKLELEATQIRSYEKQVLNLHIQAALSNFEIRRKEACGHVFKIGGLIHKIRESGQLEDPSLSDKHQEWKDYVKSCEGAIDELLELCKSSQQALDSGQRLAQLLPLPLPALPSVPKPPSDQSLMPQQQPVPDDPRDDGSANTDNAEAAVHTHSERFASKAEQAEDDADAYLRMVFNGAVPQQLKQEQAAPARADPPSSIRPPPGLPQRPLSQGPIPLAVSQSSRSSQKQQPLPMSSSRLSSSSSSSSSSLSTVKLPSGQVVGRPPLASIAAKNLRAQLPGPPLQPRPSGPTPGPAQTRPQQKSTFERLVSTIQETFPAYTRGQIQKIIEDLRREHGGSLGGFSFDNLARCIVERIVDGTGIESKDTSGSVPHQLPSYVEAGLSRPGRQARGAVSPSEMTCTICHEDTGPGSSPVRVLDCGHRFHEDCIQSWLKVNQTCPNCRSHSLLEEDFPSLTK